MKGACLGRFRLICVHTSRSTSRSGSTRFAAPLDAAVATLRPLWAGTTPGHRQLAADPCHCQRHSRWDGAPGGAATGAGMGLLMGAEEGALSPSPSPVSRAAACLRPPLRGSWGGAAEALRCCYPCPLLLLWGRWWACGARCRAIDKCPAAASVGAAAICYRYCCCYCSSCCCCCCCVCAPWSLAIRASGPGACVCVCVCIAAARRGAARAAGTCFRQFSSLRLRRRLSVPARPEQRVVTNRSRLALMSPSMSETLTTVIVSIVWRAWAFSG